MVAHPEKREQRPFYNFSLISCSGTKGVVTIIKLSTHERRGSRKRRKGSIKRVNHRLVSLYRFKQNSTLGFQVHSRKTGVGGNRNGLLHFLCHVNYPNMFFDKPGIREKCHKQKISLYLKNDWIK